MDAQLKNQLKKLPPTEKLELMSFLWDELSEEESVELSKEHKAILDQRLAQIQKGEMTYRDWDDVKNDLKKRYEA